MAECAMNQNCCVKGCDTDDVVVSHTSLFFVKFPFDQELLGKWVDILVNNDLCFTDRLHADARICSVHFNEDDFGHHSEFGYRYLLPTAVPSIFPSVIDAKASLAELDERLDERMDEFDMVDMEDNDIITNELDLIEKDKEITLKYESLATVEELGEEAECLGEQVPVQEIGIEYADGVYYFLQSDNETDQESVEQVWIDESSYPEAVTTANDLEENESDSELVYYEEDEKYIADCESSEQKSLVLIAKPNDADGVDETMKVNIIGDLIEEQDDKSVVESEYHNLEMLHETLSVVDDSKTVSSVYTALEVLDYTSTMSNVSPAPAKTSRVDKHFCVICGKGFPYESALLKHNPVHTGVKAHTCQECGKTYSQKINLTVHMRKHSGLVPAKKHECHVCQRKCTRMSELKTHLKTHWKQFPHGCALCPERFKEFTCYVDHVKATHKGELTTAEFASLIAQNENTRLITGSKIEAIEPVKNDGRYTCTFCPKQCRSTTSLKRHLRLMHPKVFICQYCQKRYLYRSHLEKHIRMHTNEKPFACTKCDNVFSQKINLDVHVKRKHTKGRVKGRRPPIMACPKLTVECLVPSAKDSVPRSTDDDATPRATVSVSCSDCSRTFETMAGMKRHYRNVHTSKGDTTNDLLPSQGKYVVFSCDMCPKEFYNKDTLVSHRQRYHSKANESVKIKLVKAVDDDSAMGEHSTNDLLGDMGVPEKDMHLQRGVLPVAMFSHDTDYHATVEVPLTTVDGSDLIQYTVDLFD